MVVLWKCRISRIAKVPGRYLLLLGVIHPDCERGDGVIILRSVFPPVDFLAVCFVLGIFFFRKQTTKWRVALSASGDSVNLFSVSYLVFPFQDIFRF